MHVTSVEYKQLATVPGTFGNVSVGMTAAVAMGESRHVALKMLKANVEEAVAAAVEAQEGYCCHQCRSAEYQLEAARERAAAYREVLLALVETMDEPDARAAVLERADALLAEDEAPF